MTVVPVEERRKKLVALWLGVAVLFGALLGVARATRTGLDDPDGPVTDDRPVSSAKDGSLRQLRLECRRQAVDVQLDERYVPPAS